MLCAPAHLQDTLAPVAIAQNADLVFGRVIACLSLCLWSFRRCLRLTHYPARKSEVTSLCRTTFHLGTRSMTTGDAGKSVVSGEKRWRCWARAGARWHLAVGGSMAIIGAAGGRLGASRRRSRRCLSGVSRRTAPLCRRGAGEGGPLRDGVHVPLGRRRTGRAQPQAQRGHHRPLSTLGRPGRSRSRSTVFHWKGWHRRASLRAGPLTIRRHRPRNRHLLSGLVPLAKPRFFDADSAPTFHQSQMQAEDCSGNLSFRAGRRAQRRSVGGKLLSIRSLAAR